MNVTRTDTTGDADPDLLDRLAAYREVLDEATAADAASRVPDGRAGARRRDRRRGALLAAAAGVVGLGIAGLVVVDGRDGAAPVLDGREPPVDVIPGPEMSEPPPDVDEPEPAPDGREPPVDVIPDAPDVSDASPAVADDTEVVADIQGDIDGVIEDQFELLALGDSVMLGAAARLSNAGIVVDAQESRQLVDMVPVVQELRDRDLLGTTVIVHLGTQGTIGQESLDQFMDALSGVPNVLVLTVKANRSWAAGNNEKLRAHSSRPNVILIDWEQRAAECTDDCFAADGIHLRAEGQRFYSRLILDVLGLVDGVDDGSRPSSASSSTHSGAAD